MNNLHPPLDLLGHCPKCGASWKGDPIPEALRPQLGGRTHFTLCISLKRQGEDRIHANRCPDCNEVFPK